MLQATFQKYTLHFKFDAGTSRGMLKEKETWFIKLWEDQAPKVFGLGEAGPLKKLSIDDIEDFDARLKDVLDQLQSHTLPTDPHSVYELVRELVPNELPSVAFGIETALLDLLNGGKRRVFDTPFYSGDERIRINGLIWMGHTESMLLQISEKVASDFDCIKMKIGSLNFDKECDILDFVRRKYYQQDLILRVDANGAFKPQEAMAKLSQLSQFKLHSIEQPIQSGQIEVMKELCAKTPVPIALDEELIGIHDYNQKKALLASISPQYIILKPTLLGGLRSSMEWIQIANELDIGWWLTSALESNIGLNAVSQFASFVKAQGHQGLGTGQLYHNNIPSPLAIERGFIGYDQSGIWDLDLLKI